MAWGLFRVNYIIINGHTFQVQHIAPRAAMGVGETPTTDPKRVSPALKNLVAKGLWNKDSTDYNLIALPTDPARSAATGVTRHDSRYRKASLVLPADFGTESGYDEG
jgi:hypothetical protein